MKRFLLLVCCLAVWGCTSRPASEEVKFLVFSDLHYDIMPDGDERLQTILEQARKSGAAFVIELGDFVSLGPGAEKVRAMLDESPVKVYHVLGNHDLDNTDKTAYTTFWGMPAPYYYFDRGKFRFIVLDTGRYIDSNGVCTPYEKGNYYSVEESKRNRFGCEQLEWLDGVLQDTTHICMLFCHGPVNDGYDRIVQNKAVHRIITDARNQGTRIAGVFGGHIHSDNYHSIDGIPYFQINSASNIWGGEAFCNTERYPDSVYRAHPSLKYVVPYETSVYAVIEADAAGTVTVRGTKSRYVKPEADRTLLETKPYPCSPEIADRVWRYY